jgi:1-acyl-sn-glycerol-3-phosphate acyltransferase
VSSSDRTSSQPGLAGTLFTNRNFIFLWAAYGISAFGDHLSELALLKMQNALSADVTDLTRRQAVMLFVFMFPFCVLGPLWGWVADRLPRKWIMIAADLVRTVILFEMFAILTGLHRWMMPALAQDAPLPLSIALLPMLLVGTFAAMFSPARTALLPSVIRQDQIIRANAMTAGLGMIASIASAVASGYLLAAFSVTGNFRIDALTFLLSAALIACIRPPATHRTGDSQSGVSAILEGLRYVRKHRRVVEVIALSTILWAGASVIQSIIPALVRDVFGGDYKNIGQYRGLLGAGLLTGSLILTMFGGALRSELAISWSFKLAGVTGLMLALAVFMRWPNAVCGAAILLIGVFGAGVQVSVNAMLQRITPDYIRGRVFGVHDLCTMTGLLAATGLLGIPHWPNIDRYIALIAAITSLMLLITGIGTTMTRLRRGRFGSAITFWRNLNEFYCRWWARVRRDGVCTVPANGPVIVAANHGSTLDPFLLGATSPNRYISYVIAREYAVIPLFRRLVELMECVPVNRTGNDTASVRAILRHLESGKCLGIFPQGRIQFPGEELDLREGVGMIALRSGATVVPAYISGVHQPQFKSGSRWTNTMSMLAPLLRRQRACVRYGRPIDMSRWKGREKDRNAYREVAEQIMAAVVALRRTEAEHRP